MEKNTLKKEIILGNMVVLQIKGQLSHYLKGYRSD